MGEGEGLELLDIHGNSFIISPVGEFSLTSLGVESHPWEVIDKVTTLFGEVWTIARKWDGELYRLADDYSNKVEVGGKYDYVVRAYRVDQYVTNGEIHYKKRP